MREDDLIVTLSLFTRRLPKSFTSGVEGVSIGVVIFAYKTNSSSV